MPERGGWSRREVLRGGAALATGSLLAPLAGRAQEPRRRPNVVFIFTDDQNFDTFGCYGSQVLTPHLDRLAREGVRFDRAYAVASICTPSRYTALTGQYAGRCQSESFLRACPPGAPSNVGFNVQVLPGSYTVGRVLREHGYATGLVGKWHTGGAGIQPIPKDADLRDPQVVAKLVRNQERLSEYIRNCGFDYAARLYRGNLADHKLDNLTVHNPEWVIEGALEFIDQQRDRPFFLMVNTTLQHSPQPARSIDGDPLLTPVGYLPQAPQVQPPRDTIRQRVRAAGLPEATAHATWLDDGVGAIVQRLAAHGLTDDTVIIVLSDNATRGGKGTCYEGGAHVPGLMSWKSHIAPGTVCDQLVANLDIVPTVLDLCGAKAPPEMTVDGSSLVPLVTGQTTTWRDALLLEVGHTRAVVTRQHKYLALRYGPSVAAQLANGTLGRPAYHLDTVFDLMAVAQRTHPAYLDADQLYDLTADPTEQRNLAADPAHAADLARLQGRLKELLAGLGRPFGEFTG